MDHIMNKIKENVLQIEAIEAVLLVGSYATSTQKVDSDIDLILICEDKKELLKRQSFFESFGKIKHQDIENYGACTSVRVFYEDSYEVEFGFVDKSWLDKPLDPGTKAVLDPAYKVIINKNKSYDL